MAPGDIAVLKEILERQDKKMDEMSAVITSQGKKMEAMSATINRMLGAVSALTFVVVIESGFILKMIG